MQSCKCSVDLYVLNLNVFTKNCVHTTLQVFLHNTWFGKYLVMLGFSKPNPWNKILNPLPLRIGTIMKPVGLQFDFQNIHRSFRKHNFFTLSHIRCDNVVYIFSVLSSTNHYFNINSRIIDVALCNCIIEQFQK